MQVTNNWASTNQVRLLPVSNWAGKTVTYAYNNNTMASGTFANVNQLTSPTAGSVVTTAQYPQQFVTTAATPTVVSSTSPTAITSGITSFVYPTVDISETSSDIVVSAYVGNRNVDDVSLSVAEDSLTISGSTNALTGIQVFNRTVALSTIIRADLADATLKSGILEIRLPKIEKYEKNVTSTTAVVR
ncbi:Hsp20/alpha crystallin family protein [Clostridium ganghwense]|uniref:SHSP domain-containing protein n=1 Tax=Clostridium ganghwense TaxID=312089 RepID=A0ABT4CRY2_9CLOT|nr:hypothetical protein [Clostridium ganghwense]MCY6371824.1 hypothetical protein [Clostridium ganghwense]